MIFVLNRVRVWGAAPHLPTQGYIECPPRGGCPIFLARSGYYGQPVLSLYIYVIFLYHVNQCRVQLGTNKVVVVVIVAASIHYYSTETDITHMDDSQFFIFPPIFEKVVKWDSVSFEFYLLVRVILHEFHSIRGHSRDVTHSVLSNISLKGLNVDALRGLIEAKH